MTTKKDIWHYREKLKDNKISPERQVIIDIGDQEGPHIGASSGSAGYIYLVGLYEWTDSYEPKKVPVKDIIRWCYFSDFVTNSLCKDKK